MTEKKASSSSSRPSSVPCKEKQGLSARRVAVAGPCSDPAATGKGSRCSLGVPECGQSHLPHIALRPLQRPRFAFEDLLPQPGPGRATGTL